MQCLILAGGLGTRMRPYTEAIPKAMIPVAGKPFIHYQLKLLASQGVQSVVLAIGYLGSHIRDYVQDGRAWHLTVDYIDEGKDLLGTGGALRLACDSGLLNNEFFVMYGDSYLRAPFVEIKNAFSRLGNPALLTVFKNVGLWDKSNVIFDKERVQLYDKWSTHSKLEYIDYGLAVFQRTIIGQFFPAGEKGDLAHMLHDLSLKGLLAGFEVKERFFEIGSRDGLSSFETWVRDQRYD